MDLDFIGFTYNGKHSYRDLKIYRTSNGDRYEDNVLPTLTEKTAAVDGMVGQYYFGTQVGPRTFNISFAFDEVTEAGLQEIKRTFNGEGIHDLIFDEEPYKVYSAKVTGTATVKHLCFEIEGSRVYRGEGSVQFTCYYPYAHSRGVIGSSIITPIKQIVTYGQVQNGGQWGWEKVSGPSQSLNCGIIVNEGDVLTYPKFIENVTIYYLDKDGSGVIRLPSSSFHSYTFAKTLMISKLTFQYKWLETLTEEFDDKKAEMVITISSMGTNTNYYYTNNNCFEKGAAPSTLSGKVLNNYNIVDFPNKWQWGQASGLPLHTDDSINHGEMPTPFVLEATVGEITKGTRFTVNANTITVGEKCVGLIWNSKNGLVKATAESDSTTRAILYSGNSISTIPVGASGQATGLNGTTPVAATANFDYWYY